LDGYLLFGETKSGAATHEIITIAASRRVESRPDLTVSANRRNIIYHCSELPNNAIHGEGIKNK
jgi:hypothetical protein